jgi:hypothetical protein
MYIEPGGYVTEVDRAAFETMKESRSTSLRRLALKAMDRAYCYVDRGELIHIITTWDPAWDDYPSKWLDRTGVIEYAANVMLALPGPRRVDFSGGQRGSKNRWSNSFTVADIDRFIEDHGELFTYADYQG